MSNMLEKIKNTFGIKINVDVETFFWLQHSLDNHINFFNRYDVIVRILAIEDYFKENDFGFALYLKMQNLRKQTHKYIPNNTVISSENFIDLIKSYQEKGFDNSYPIKVNRFFELSDGSHRFALSLYDNLTDIPIILSTDMYDCRFYYGLDWFLENGFSSAEIDLIENKYKMIKNRYLKQYIGIVWPPAFNYANDILLDIKKTYNIYECKDLFFTDKEKFKEFVFDIYNIDNISNEKIIKKIEIFNKYPLKIKVFKFSAFVNDYVRRVVNDKCMAIPYSINKEKESLRKQFKNRVEDYYYDTILHMNDTQYDFLKIEELIECKFKDTIVFGETYE